MGMNSLEISYAGSRDDGATLLGSVTIPPNTEATPQVTLVVPVAAGPRNFNAVFAPADSTYSATESNVQAVVVQ